MSEFRVMLRIVQSRSSGQAKSYYTQSFSVGDYYTKGESQERIGHWHGNAARRLGLQGQVVTQETFFALAENQHPETGRNLTPRFKANRTVGYDLTCGPSGNEAGC